MTQIPGKPSIEDSMKHFGIQGMHWGVRKSKAVAGISRPRGILIDRNARSRKVIQDARSGKKYRLRVAVGRKVFGEERQKKNWETHLSDLNAQDKRLKAGKLTVMDHLDVMAEINLADLLISTTPKNKAKASGTPAPRWTPPPGYDPKKDTELQELIGLERKDQRNSNQRKRRSAAKKAANKS